MMQFITVVQDAASFHLTPCSQGMIIGPKITEHTSTYSFKQIYMYSVFTDPQYQNRNLHLSLIKSATQQAEKSGKC